VFHKVDVKPGKPVWFGTSGERRAEGGEPEKREPDGVSSFPSTFNPQPSTSRHATPPAPPSEGREPGAGRCHVFGLPGNPVSSLVCFELFARTAMRRLMGVEPAEPQPVRARLEQAHVARGERPTYHPA